MPQRKPTTRKAVKKRAPLSGAASNRRPGKPIRHNKQAAVAVQARLATPPPPPAPIPGFRSPILEDAIATNDAERCTARRKVCRNPANGCEYRYPRGDPSHNCPVCGFPRRCKNRVAPGFSVCRMHGANPKGIKSAKYMISAQISAAFNRILAHPSLLELSQEIAIAASRTDQIMDMMNDNNPAASVDVIMSATNMIEAGMVMHQDNQMHAGLALLRAALDPAFITKRLWEEWRENTELIRRLSETERKWSFANKQTVPINQVLEFTIWLQQLVLKYLPNPTDRAALAREIRAVFPVATAEAAGIRTGGIVDVSTRDSAVVG